MTHQYSHFQQLYSYFLNQTLGSLVPTVVQFSFLSWSATIKKTFATLNLSVICTIPINPFSYGLL